MQILYQQNQGMTLHFSPRELGAACIVLRFIYNATGMEFVKDAIRDIEQDLKPKQITMKNYFHICTTCFCEVDEREQNSLHIVNGDMDKWKHITCPPLKEGRPV